MGKDVLYAGGFPRIWKTDAEEIKASQKKDGWHPATIDFKATADASGSGATPVSSLSDVLNFLRTKTDGMVDELIIIGHATNGAFALGGEIIPPRGEQPGTVKFTGGNYINDVALSGAANQIEPLKAKFAKNGKIVLVGCNAGLGATLLEQFSKAFGVCVLGFSDFVWTGFMVLPGNPPNPPSISSRGHVYFDSSGLMAAGMGPPVAAWPKDVGKLATDRKSANCP